VKYKIETGTPSENTILNSLKDARSQLPPKLPGIVFVRVPRPCLEDKRYTERLKEIAINFLKTTSRVVSTKFYTTSVPVDSDSMGEVMALREIVSPRQDFGIELDWHLFPTEPAVDPNVLMIAANWFRLR
jgi:hypothetical protein